MTRISTKENRQDEDDHDVLVPVPPDGGYGWVVVLASFICNMMVDGISYCFGIFLNDLVMFYGESESTVSWVGSILTGTTMCSGPLVSAIANKLGCRTTCMTGSLISAVCFAISIFCPNVQLLMLVYGVGAGIGFGLMYVPAVVCVGYYFETKRSLATGIAVCGSGVGTIVFAPLGTYLLQTYGWRNANLVLGAMCLMCVLFGYLMKPLEYNSDGKTVTMIYENVTSSNDGSRKSHRSLADVSASRHSLASIKSKKSHALPPLSRQDVLYSGSLRNLKEFQSQKSLHDFRQSMVSIHRSKSRYSDGSSTGIKNFLKDLIDVSLLKDPVFLMVALSNVFGFMALYVPFVYTSGAAEKDGIDSSSAAYLISYIGITNTIGRLVCGFVADSPKVNTLLVNNLCLSVMAIAVLGAAFCYNYTTYVIMTCVYGSAMAGYISLTSIILVELLGLEKLTDAFGLLILFRGSGALLGSPLAGFIIKSTDTYKYAFMSSSIFLVVSTILSFAIPYVYEIKQKTVTMDEASITVNLKQHDETA